MEVFINQQAISTTEDAPLQSVMEERGFSSAQGIAVAVNDTVIPSQDWGQHTLQPNDKIIIIRATQGG